MKIMPSIKRLLIILITFVVSVFSFSSFVHAEDEFITTYNINFQVNADVSVSVEQKVELTNKLANVYASEYKINLGTTRIRDVWAKDNGGTITPIIEKRENSTTINLKFNQKVVGKGNTLSFTLGYISDDYAMKNGRVLEIGIPRIAESQKLDDYQVNLSIPKAFENPVFILPSPTSISSTNSYTNYFFNKQKLLNQSITAAFGNFQVFNFTLFYHLTNKNPTKVSYEVVFPPDTPYQKVLYQSIIPAPENINIDQDGNWIATYVVNALEKLEIVASGSAEIYIKPKDENIKEIINPDDFLTEQEFWETSNPEIKALALELKTPQKIYNYVVDNLLYDYAKVEKKPERMGAVAVLNNKSSAVCMEFTDLFVALCRAAGIPAREVNGYSYTSNPQLRPLSLEQDILHAWPQYYDNDRKIWVNVDPTWGNTTGGIDFFQKLDLNHFTFVFHGLDSEYPHSPGSYKSLMDEGKDILIDFGEQISSHESLQVYLELPEKIMAGLSIKGKIIVKNTGNVASYNKIVSLVSPDLNVKDKKYPIKILPPFASYEQNITFPKTSIFTSENKKITLKIDDVLHNHEVEVKSLFPKFIAKPLSRLANWISTLIKNLSKIKL
ncbi:transglutaminase family protein [Patescibacteria group bacterium]